MRKSALSVIFSLFFLKFFVPSKKFALIIFFFAISIPSAFSQPHWTPTNALANGRYDDTYFININTGYIVWGGGMMYKTTDAGNTWINNYNNPSVRFRCIGFFDENNGVMGTLTDTASFFRTTNAGANWTKVTDFLGTGPSPRGVCGINIVNENLAYAVGIYDTPAYFLKSTNKGANWTSIKVDTSLARGLVDVYFWSADSGIVVGNYSLSPAPNTTRAAVLFTSDGGNSFNRVYLSPRPFEWCWKISFPTKNTGYVSVQALNRTVVLKTTNRGQNWTDFVMTDFVNIQGIGFANENTGWVGKSTGSTYKTTDGGTTWNEDAWGQNVNRFRMFSDTSGYAAGLIVYKFTTKPVGIQQISSEIPGQSYLSQNYPNPFNPVTNIKYKLTYHNFVILKIYDTKGKEISELVNDIQNPGEYSISFDASELPSGVYYYKLITSEFQETRKMVLIK